MIESLFRFPVSLRPSTDARRIRVSSSDTSFHAPARAQPGPGSSVFAGPGVLAMEFAAQRDNADLTGEEVKQLLILLRTKGCQDSRQLLILHCLRWLGKLVARFTRGWSRPVDVADAEESALLAIIEAIDTG